MKMMSGFAQIDNARELAEKNQDLSKAIEELLIQNNLLAYDIFHKVIDKINAYIKYYATNKYDQFTDYPLTINALYALKNVISEKTKMTDEQIDDILKGDRMAESIQLSESDKILNLTLEIENHEVAQGERMAASLNLR
ncbi:MAG: hypothetical protein IPH62_16400 [Ignavibacteriae bacterium]|nr:hypothetical protein [Ignavibacteriota bacterium]